jgi:8-oxo-dGTP pyrophosphatase MutT (NUDIX family)
MTSPRSGIDVWESALEIKDYSHVEAKPAATVLLARDSADGVEVFMVKRHHKIDFAAGAMVFPGGKVDEADAAPALRDYCAGADALDDADLALRVAAVRETFEECGVLLARPRGEADLVDGGRLADLHGWAAKLNDNTATMAEFVEAENIELALDELAHFAHWITPPVVPKRFDTHFYLAWVPADQVAVHDGAESVASSWSKPGDVIKAADADEVRLVFATRMNLTKLGAHADVAAAMAATRRAGVVTVQPVLESYRDGVRKLRIPPEAGYGGELFSITDKPAM